MEGGGLRYHRERDVAENKQPAGGSMSCGLYITSKVNATKKSEEARDVLLAPPAKLTLNKKGERYAAVS